MIRWGAAYGCERLRGFFVNDLWTTFANLERIEMSAGLNTGALGLAMVCWSLGVIRLEMMIDKRRRLIESEETNFFGWLDGV
jgi:hypothetical protein